MSNFFAQVSFAYYSQDDENFVAQALLLHLKHIM